MDIQIQPTLLSGEIRAISSKSDVHRLLIASALAKGGARVQFTTLSEDIAATVDVLRTLGAAVTVDGEDGDYIATVTGITAVQSGVTLDANECGTTARLILPIAAALTDSFTFTGKNGLTKRPFADLCDCITENGTVCSDTLLPITTNGKLKSGIFKIRGDVSSQYISGLLFALPLLRGDSEIVLTSRLVSAGYVDMTLGTLRLFGIDVQKTAQGFFIKGNQKYTNPILPKTRTSLQPDGDWSNSSFWLCGGAIGNTITVHGLSSLSEQKDRAVWHLIERAGAYTVFSGLTHTTASSPLRGIDVNGEDIPDALPVLATMLALAKGKSVITGGARLRIKESDRIATTVAMLKALGADIEGTDDGFIINGVENFTGGTVDAAGDHRIAMCAAIASQRASGPVIIRGAECVNKSYPTFFADFEKLGGNYSVIHG